MSQITWKEGIQKDKQVGGVIFAPGGPNISLNLSRANGCLQIRYGFSEDVGLNITCIWASRVINRRSSSSTVKSKPCSSPGNGSIKLCCSTKILYPGVCYWGVRRFVRFYVRLGGLVLDIDWDQNRPSLTRSWRRSLNDYSAVSKYAVRKRNPSLTTGLGRGVVRKRNPSLTYQQEVGQ